MQKRYSLALVDGNSRRRAAITHALAGSGIHVEPFEDLGEITFRWPRTGAILVADQGPVVDDLIGHMSLHGEWLPVIAFSEDPGTERIVRAVLAGALDYLEWPCDPAKIVTAVTLAESASASIGSLRLREARARSRVQKLTRREREVLEGVADGLSNRLIGEKLRISPRTVEIHRANMLNKMGASHTSEAIRIAIEASLVGQAA
ncbi:MAG TPA: LuxR C-terminal-related transcriptional regulator [Novosphingobium sp.]|nr:LuxR C-terminal-related transcriptional regulator [Novosphingobium sp.]